ncbi:MAG: NAD(P) transhydrogenase subunit alpha, partial [Polaromonas sp.]
MKFGVPKESNVGEARVALTPNSARFIQKLGHECLVESGAGKAARYSDQDYVDAGVTVVKSAEALWQESDFVAKIRPMTESDEALARDGQTVISFFYPAQNEAQLERTRAAGLNVIAMDMVPRISRA